MPKLKMHSSQASSSRLSSATYPTLQHKCCLRDSFNAASIQRSLQLQLLCPIIYSVQRSMNT